MQEKNKSKVTNSDIEHSSIKNDIFFQQYQNYRDKSQRININLDRHITKLLEDHPEPQYYDDLWSMLFTDCMDDDTRIQNIANKYIDLLYTNYKIPISCIFLNKNTASVSNVYIICNLLLNRFKSCALNASNNPGAYIALTRASDGLKMVLQTSKQAALRLAELLGTKYSGALQWIQKLEVLDLNAKCDYLGALIPKYDMNTENAPTYHIPTLKALALVACTKYSDKYDYQFPIQKEFVSLEEFARTTIRRIPEDNITWNDLTLPFSNLRILDIILFQNARQQSDSPNQNISEILNVLIEHTNLIQNSDTATNVDKQNGPHADCTRIGKAYLNIALILDKMKFDPKGLVKGDDDFSITYHSNLIHIGLKLQKIDSKSQAYQNFLDESFKLFKNSINEYPEYANEFLHQICIDCNLLAFEQITKILNSDHKWPTNDIQLPNSNKSVCYMSFVQSCRKSIYHSEHLGYAPTAEEISKMETILVKHGYPHKNIVNYASMAITSSASATIGIICSLTMQRTLPAWFCPSPIFARLMDATFIGYNLYWYHHPSSNPYTSFINDINNSTLKIIMPCLNSMSQRYLLEGNNGQDKEQGQNFCTIL